MVRLVSGSLVCCFFESLRCSLPSFPRWDANGLWFSSRRPSDTQASCFKPTSTPTTREGVGGHCFLTSTWIATYQWPASQDTVAPRILTDSHTTCLRLLRLFVGTVAFPFS